MRYKRRVEDFTPEEIARFDHMQEVLEEYNRLVDAGWLMIQISILMQIMPLYSDIEMAEHSQYREIWLDWRCRDFYEGSS